MRFHRGWDLGYWSGGYAGGLGWRPVVDHYPGFQGVGLGGARPTGWSRAWVGGFRRGCTARCSTSTGILAYHNPYHDETAVADKQPAAYDYSHPLNAQSAVPPKLATDRAVSTFKSARQGFRRGDYQSALILVDHALKLMPDDPTMHEFRALTLFALGRSDEAAGARLCGPVD